MEAAPLCHCPHTQRCDGRLQEFGSWSWRPESDDHKRFACLTDVRLPTAAAKNDVNKIGSLARHFRFDLEYFAIFQVGANWLEIFQLEMKLASAR